MPRGEAPPRVDVAWRRRRPLSGASANQPRLFCQPLQSYEPAVVMLRDAGIGGELIALEAKRGHVMALGG